MMIGADHGVRVLLPAALLPLFPNCPAAVMIAATTVAEAIDTLDARYPGLRARLCDERSVPRRHIRIYVNGTPATLDTTLDHHAEIVILTAISGG